MLPETTTPPLHCETPVPVPVATDRHRSLMLCPHWNAETQDWALMEEAQRSYTETFGPLALTERLSLRLDGCDLSDWRFVDAMPPDSGTLVRHITLDALRRPDSTLVLAREKETLHKSSSSSSIIKEAYHHDWTALMPLYSASQIKRPSGRVELGRTATTQFVVQRVEPGGAIGEAGGLLPERHPGITQVLQILYGQCLVTLSADAEGLFVMNRLMLYEQAVLVIPPGQYHLVRNVHHTKPLFLFSIYSPPEPDDDSVKTKK